MLNVDAAVVALGYLWRSRTVNAFLLDEGPVLLSDEWHVVTFPSQNRELVMHISLLVDQFLSEGPEASNQRVEPCIYGGRRFRSRLKATWSAFFTMIGWEWEYEACNLNGWIPDFRITGTDGRFFYIEVHDGLVFPKKLAAEITGAYVLEGTSGIVGSSPFSRDSDTSLGWMSTPDAQGEWEEAAFGHIASEQLCVCSRSGSSQCIICGSNEYLVAWMEPTILDVIWASACQKVQGNHGR